MTLEFSCLGADPQTCIASHFEFDDLLSFSQTSKSSQALVRKRQVLSDKIKRPALFCFEMLNPEQPNKRKSKRIEVVADRRPRIMQTALGLIPGKEAKIRTRCLTLLAQKSTQQAAVKYFKQAFATANLSPYDTDVLQWLIVRSLKPINPKLANELALKIKDSHRRALAFCEIDNTPTRAIKTARLIKKQYDKDSAYSEIAKKFLTLGPVSEMAGPKEKALLYMKLAKKEPFKKSAAELVLKATQEAEKIEPSTIDQGYYKVRILKNAVVMLRQENSDQTSRVLELFLNAITNYHSNDTERSALVDKLKTVDVDMALKTAISGDKTLCTYSEKVFYRLMNIVDAQAADNPEKAHEILNEALVIRQQITLPHDKLDTAITVAYLYLQKNDFNNALKFIREAETLSGTTYTDTQKYYGLAKVADALAWINKEEAQTFAHKAVAGCTSRAIFPDEYIEIIRILKRHFPEKAKELLLHCITHCNTNIYPEYAFKYLCDLCVEIDAVDSTIAQALFDSIRGDSFYLAERGAHLHKVSPKKAVALFKMALSQAREKNVDVSRYITFCAEKIAKIYPQVAAALYHEAFQLENNTKHLLEIAKLTPEHALDILAFAVEVESKNPNANNLEEIIKALAELAL